MIVQSYLNGQSSYHIVPGKVYQQLTLVDILSPAERSISVGRALDLGSKSCWFETHRSHCVVSLSKTLYPSGV